MLNIALYESISLCVREHSCPTILLLHQECTGLLGMFTKDKGVEVFINGLAQDFNIYIKHSMLEGLNEEIFVHAETNNLVFRKSTT